MFAVLITALLVIPWRSNFMVFQLPEKQATNQAIPTIEFEPPQKQPM